MTPTPDNQLPSGSPSDHPVAAPAPAEIVGWTFFGHWDDDHLVVEFATPGEQDDDRDDTGYWDQGLWAAWAAADTQQDAMDGLAAEYEAVSWRWGKASEQTPGVDGE